MQEDLIIDVGMNHGEDTEYYLSRGYRVVAIEANPNLVEKALVRFADALASNQLVIIDKGIAKSAGKLDFWINESNDHHSSFIESVGSRNNSRSRKIQVETIPFSEILN